MDTFVDSAWYFMRFCDPANVNSPFDTARLSALMPVDAYVGGIEHAILHLLYARFITKFVASQGFLTGAVTEPFKTLITQGMVHGRTFKSSVSGRYLKPHEVDTTGAEPVETETGKAVQIVWEKMSKSKYNGVDPQDMVEKFGADAVRAAMLFKAPPDIVLEWDDASIGGVMRWIGRLHTSVIDYASALKTQGTVNRCNAAHDAKRDAAAELRLVAHTAIKIVTNALIVDRTFNTAVSEGMKLTNAIRAAMPVLVADDGIASELDEAFDILMKLLAPVTPHIASEAWSTIQTARGHIVDLKRTSPGVGADGVVGDVHCQSWPVLDPSALVGKALIKVPVAIHGKTRSVIEVPRDSQISFVEKAAQDDPKVQRLLKGKKIKKIIVVAGLK
eukprot:Opistho-2@85008